MPKSNAVAEGIPGLFFKGPGLISNKPDSIIPSGAMPHGIGVWPTTSRITLKSNPPGNFVLGKSLRDPTFLWVRIHCWTGPKLKPKKDLRSGPASNPGVFLGYAMRPGFIWTNEYLVASLKDLMEKDFNEPVPVIRVNQLTAPEGPFIYPLKGRYKATREGFYESLSLAALQTPRRWMPKQMKISSLRKRASINGQRKVKKSSRS